MDAEGLGRKLPLTLSGDPRSAPERQTVGAVTASQKIRDRKGTPKNFCDKDFDELPGEFSGAICLKTLVLLGSALELFRKFFGAVRAIFWLWGSFLGS